MILIISSGNVHFPGKKKVETCISMPDQSWSLIWNLLRTILKLLILSQENGYDHFISIYLKKSYHCTVPKKRFVVTIIVICFESLLLIYLVSSLNLNSNVSSQTDHEVDLAMAILCSRYMN